MDKDTLARLAALDLSTDPYLEAKKLIYQLQRIGAIEYSLHPGKTLTRGRSNGVDDQRGPSFTKVADLSFKPQQYNTTYQRASTPRQTMFYGSVLSPQNEENLFERMISVSEVSALLRHSHRPNNNPDLQQEGITFGSWVATDDVPMVALCYNQQLAQRTSLGRELYAAFEHATAQLDSPLREQSRAANAFFAAEFAKPSQQFKSHRDYLLSAVFAEVAAERHMAGVYYPSVMAAGQGFNVAISPDYAARALRLDKVLECTLYKRDGRFMLGPDKFCGVEPGAETFELQPLSAADAVTQQQAINWFDAQVGKP
ncbi:MAG: hypothetical protein ACRYFX_17855 [Janthinobacterium lividum]